MMEQSRRIHLAVVIDYDHGSILASDVEMALEMLGGPDREVKAMAVIVSEGLHDELRSKADLRDAKGTLLRRLAEEGAARCQYLPGSGNPDAWPDARCDCKYLGPSGLATTSEQTGCCEMRVAYRVLQRSVPPAG